MPKTTQTHKTQNLKGELSASHLGTMEREPANGKPSVLSMEILPRTHDSVDISVFHMGMAEVSYLDVSSSQG